MRFARSFSLTRDRFAQAIGDVVDWLAFDQMRFRLASACSALGRPVVQLKIAAAPKESQTHRLAGVE